jgi:F0F1-type ATP synthase beta subunit
LEFSQAANELVRSARITLSNPASKAAQKHLDAATAEFERDAAGDIFGSCSPLAPQSSPLRQEFAQREHTTL